ncbi:hypothetical protein ACHAXS_011665 [Conticribra weissflogii]
MIIPKSDFVLSGVIILFFVNSSFCYQTGCAFITATPRCSRRHYIHFHPPKAHRRDGCDSPWSKNKIEVLPLVTPLALGSNDHEVEINKALQIISNADKSNTLDLDALHNILQHNQRLVKSILSAPVDRAHLILSNGAIFCHPKILNDLLQPNASIRSTKEWFFKFLRLTSSEEKRITSKWPTFDESIDRLGRTRIHKWFRYFLSESPLGFNRVQLKNLIISRPTLLRYKLSNIHATISFFTTELGFTRDECTAILSAYPSVLMHSVDSRLRPTVEFLQNNIGGGRDNWNSWKNVVVSYPKLFSHSLEKTLLPKVNFLRGLDGREREKEERCLALSKSEVSQVVAKFPPTLWLSEENLTSKLEFLSESLDLDQKELRALVVSYPQILGLSVENNLRPKMEFFLHPNATISKAPLRNSGSTQDHDDAVVNCGLSKRQLKEFVLYQPALLAYSLEKRLKPRIREMQEHKILFFYSPKGIMSYTDEKFELWMSTQVTTWSVSEE